MKNSIGKKHKNLMTFFIVVYKSKGKEGEKVWGNENFLKSHNIFYEFIPKWKEILINSDWNSAP